MKKHGQSPRGAVKSINLKKSITLNANVVTKAVIEIDHINYGINKKTGKLKGKKRTHFTVNDIEKFIAMLDGDYLMPRNHRGRISRFEVKIDCPVRGHFFGKEFMMVFEIDYDKPEEIYTVTLFPGW